MTGRPEVAYAVYRNMEITYDSLTVLDFIANQCYKACSDFYHPALYTKHAVRKTFMQFQAKNVCSSKIEILNSSSSIMSQLIAEN